MIVVDASALLAIALDEPEGALYREKLLAVDRVLLSPVNLWEAAVRLERSRGQAGVQELRTLLAALEVEVVGTSEEHAWSAASAFARFGRGTPADLNLGDCFAYALARSGDLPLLYKGEDFPRTDVRSAL